MVRPGLRKGQRRKGPHVTRRLLGNPKQQNWLFRLGLDPANGTPSLAPGSSPANQTAPNSARFRASLWVPAPSLFNEACALARLLTAPSMAGKPLTAVPTLVTDPCVH